MRKPWAWLSMALKQHQKVGSGNFQSLESGHLSLVAGGKEPLSGFLMLWCSPHSTGPVPLLFQARGNVCLSPFHLETDEAKEQGVLVAGSGPSPTPNPSLFYLSSPLLPQLYPIPLTIPLLFPFPLSSSLPISAMEGRDHEIVTVTLSLQGYTCLWSLFSTIFCLFLYWWIIYKAILKQLACASHFCW